MGCRYLIQYKTQATGKTLDLGHAEERSQACFPAHPTALQCIFGFSVGSSVAAMDQRKPDFQLLTSTDGWKLGCTVLSALDAHSVQCPKIHPSQPEVQVISVASNFRASAFLLH